MASPAMKEIIPLYSRVSWILQNKILSGQYEPGDKLPTEDELVQYYDVSKITVRNALSLLEADGLIRRIRGKGTFVASLLPQKKQYIHSSLSKMQQALERGDTKPLEIKKLKVRDARIPKDLFNFFGLSNNEVIGLIRRMCDIRGVLYFFEDFLPVDLVKYFTKAELNKEKLLLKILKEKAGVKVSKGEMFLQAVPAEPDVSAVLQCPSFEPLIHMQTYFWTAPEKPMAIANVYFRACFFKYRVGVEINAY